MILLWLCFLWIVKTKIVSSICEYDFKVYVYPLPASFSKLSDEARSNSQFHICQKCIYEQFALEYVVLDFLSQFCGRTANPEEADFFYLPIIREIDYRIALQSGKRDPSLVETIMLDAIEKDNTSSWKSHFQVTDYYWKRYSGADHVCLIVAE